MSFTSLFIIYFTLHDSNLTPLFKLVQIQVRFDPVLAIFLTIYDPNSFLYKDLLHLKYAQYMSLNNCIEYNINVTKHFQLI